MPLPGESKEICHKLSILFCYARQDTGFTQIQVALATNLPEHFIKKVEAGKQSGPLTKILKLAQFYKLTIDDILNATEIAKYTKPKDVHRKLSILYNYI